MKFLPKDFGCPVGCFFLGGGGGGGVGCPYDAKMPCWLRLCLRPFCLNKTLLSVSNCPDMSDVLFAGD